eukprot:6863748-Lingulodinium_polyedra.AAC.1
MDGWDAPEWVRNVTCALICGRSVAARIGNKLGPLRRLARSIGMGNTPSMLLWAIGYDPVVEAAQGATYVDDLAGLTL